MLDAIKKHFPRQVDTTRPQGGLFLWAMLPDWMDAEDAFQEAIKHQVAFVPGRSFYPHGDVVNTLRLNFSNATPENIRIGIERLGKVFEQMIEEPENEFV